MFPRNMQTASHDETDPAGETITSLANWPDSELCRLARNVAGELTRRQLATPAAPPIAAAAGRPLRAAPKAFELA